MGGKCSSPERRLATLAANQHGVVARRQLAGIGFGRRAIEHRLVVGRLHAVHRGVYAVGHPSLTAAGRWMAAVLACGPGALLSHRSAAALWGLRATAATRVDVTVRAGNRCRRPGIALHLTRDLPPAEATSRGGIPVTSVARTLLDLAATLHPAQLRAVLEEAERLELLDARAVVRACDHSRGRRGTRGLRSLIEESTDPPPATRSELERRFVGLCRAAGLPSPAVNARVAGLEVDALWSGPRLIVELDGFAFHHRRAAFERDRRRDATLQLAGYRVLRVTHHRLWSEPSAVIEAVRALLGDADGRRQPVSG